MLSSFILLCLVCPGWSHIHVGPVNCNNHKSCEDQGLFSKEENAYFVQHGSAQTNHMCVKNILTVNCQCKLKNCYEKVPKICDSKRCGSKKCVDTGLGKHRCENCPVGKTGNGRYCVDINECRGNPDICGEGTCSNTHGLYTCVCEDGYNFSSYSKKCVDINECQENPDVSCGEGTCSNTPGSYTCVCGGGYNFSSDSKRCVDINECNVSDICGEGTCSNTPGSYICVCGDGHIRSADGKSCREVGCADGKIKNESACMPKTTQKVPPPSNATTSPPTTSPPATSTPTAYSSAKTVPSRPKSNETPTAEDSNSLPVIWIPILAIIAVLVFCCIGRAIYVKTRRPTEDVEQAVQNNKSDVDFGQSADFGFGRKRRSIPVAKMDQPRTNLGATSDQPRDQHARCHGRKKKSDQPRGNEIYFSKQWSLVSNPPKERSKSRNQPKERSKHTPCKPRRK